MKVENVEGRPSTPTSKKVSQVPTTTTTKKVSE